MREGIGRGRGNLYDARFSRGEGERARRTIYRFVGNNFSNDHTFEKVSDARGRVIVDKKIMDILILL